MKRYLVFAGPECYPEGGWDDLKGDFETLEEAVAAVAELWGSQELGSTEWHQIIDTQTWTVASRVGRLESISEDENIVPVPKWKRPPPTDCYFSRPI